MLTFEEIKADTIRRRIERFNGNVAEAARSLGLNRNTVQKFAKPSRKVKFSKMSNDEFVAYIRTLGVKNVKEWREEHPGSYIIASNRGLIAEIVKRLGLIKLPQGAKATRVGRGNEDAK